MVRKAEFPFDNYVKFDNDAIIETMFLNKKNVKRINDDWYYLTSDPFKGKIKLKALVMSDDYNELVWDIKKVIKGSE